MEVPGARRAAQEPAESPRPAKRGRFFGAAAPEQLTLADCLAQLAEEAPDELICPITHQLFTEPVIAADCNTYESAAILKWLATRPTSPLTNEAMRDTTVRTNRTVKALVSRWVEQQLAVASAALGKARAIADSGSGLMVLDHVWALLELADAKKAIGFLEEAFWVRLPDAPFTKRMDSFRRAAERAGFPARQACIKAYTLAAGHQSFRCDVNPMDLQEPRDPLSFLLPAVQHLRVYHFRFEALDFCVTWDESGPRFNLEKRGKEEQWFAELVVVTPCAAHEVRPVICSFASPGISKVLSMWFQFCPAMAAMESFRGGTVWTGKLPADFTVELAVRGLAGFEEQVAVVREDEGGQSSSFAQSLASAWLRGWQLPAGAAG